MPTEQIEQEQNKGSAETLAWIIYNGAALMAVAVNDPKKIPAIDEAFPSLFNKENQQEWWVMKQRLEEFRISQNITN